MGILFYSFGKSQDMRLNNGQGVSAVFAASQEIMFRYFVFMEKIDIMHLLSRYPVSLSRVDVGVKKIRVGSASTLFRTSLKIKDFTNRTTARQIKFWE